MLDVLLKFPPLGYISSVSLSYLVYRPKDCVDATLPKVPIAANSKYYYRCRRDLQSHSSLDVDLLFASKLWSIRGPRLGQPILIHSIMRIIPLTCCLDCQLMPIISITFYMVIIYVGLGNEESQPAEGLPLRFTSPRDSLGADLGNRMQVHITTLTENKVDHGRRLPMGPSIARGDEAYRTPTPSDIKFNDTGDAV